LLLLSLSSCDNDILESDFDFSDDNYISDISGKWRLEYLIKTNENLSADTIKYKGNQLFLKFDGKNTLSVTGDIGDIFCVSQGTYSYYYYRTDLRIMDVIPYDSIILDSRTIPCCSNKKGDRLLFSNKIISQGVSPYIYSLPVEKIYDYSTIFIKTK